MATPIASLQRAATNPPARMAGTTVNATGQPVGNPGPAANPYAGLFEPPSGPPPVPTPQAAPTVQTPTPVMTDPYGVVSRPAAPPAPPSTYPTAPTHLPTQVEIQARADEEARTRAAQRAADVAAGRRPAEVTYQEQIAEEQRKSNELQMQRADDLRRVTEEARVKRLDDEARQQADARQRQAEAEAYRLQLTRTPEVGAVHRTEGNLDSAAERADLSALVNTARGSGLLGPSSSSSSSSSSYGGGALGSLQAAAAPAHVTHAPANINTSAAFSRAKDRVGQIGRGALNSLQRMMSARGLAGSSIEGRGIGQAVEQGAGALSDTARSQADAEAARANAVDDQNYQGDISQRNSDIAAQEEARRFGLARDAQAQSATNAGFSNLQGLMSLVRRGRPVY